MPYQKLSQPICFSGSLKANDSEAFVTFQAHINPFGVIEIDFDKIMKTDKNSFIANQLLSFCDYSLCGKAEDGTDLSVEGLSLNVDLDQNNISLRVDRCLEAKFICKLDKPNQAITRWLIGFRSDPCRRLSQKCPLGTIVMGECSFDDPNEISGIIKIEIDIEALDFVACHDRENKLLDYVLGVMHFATGKRFKTPIIENYSGETLEVIVLSPTGENSASGIPVCSYIGRQSIFNAAVKSFFTPPFRVDNLLSAIEWFVMDSYVYEVNLIHAFTALENIIASNLEDSENGKKILPNEQFKNLHKDIKKLIKDWLPKNTSIPDEEHGKVYAKLNDLNRRSLKEKLYLLANSWSISLEGIADDQIKSAVKARNSIVHEGSYDEADINIKIEHLWVIREIVIRFIFTAIGYQGSYISHLGGYHSAHFKNVIATE